MSGHSAMFWFVLYTYCGVTTWQVQFVFQVHQCGSLLSERANCRPSLLSMLNHKGSDPSSGIDARHKWCKPRYKTKF